MDHVHAVLERDSDDVLLGEVGTDGCESLADLVGLISLGTEVNHALSCDVGMLRGAPSGDGQIICLRRSR